MNFAARSIFSASSLAVGLVKRRGSLETALHASSIPPMQKRSMHFDVTRPAIPESKFEFLKPNSAPQEHWFSEFHSLGEIHKFLGKLATAPNVYNVILGRSVNQVKGIKVYSPRARGQKSRNNGQIILMGGHQAHEWAGVAVGLYIASALSRKPIHGADVVIIPTVNPTQYDLLHQASGAFSAFVSRNSFDFAMDGFNIPVPQMQSTEVDIIASTGPVKSYIDKLGKQFTRIVQQLDSESRLLSNHQVPQGGSFLFSPFTNCIALGAMGETAFMKTVPNYIIELRDKNRRLEADQVVKKGDEIIAGLRQLAGV